jgi:integrase
MAYEIQKTTVRERLAVRVHEPYWRTLARGQALGFRKIAKPAEGYWLARMRDDATSKKYVYESLGSSAELDYETAKAKAEKWFKHTSEGVKTGEVQTVADACRAYVTERRASKSEATAHDAHKRFERTVYGRRDADTGKVLEPESPFGKTALSKLRAGRIREWRDGLKLAPGSANRTLTVLKAALNLAVRERHVSADQAIEWKHVKPLPGGKKRRDLYLDLKQRRALLKAAKGAVRDLLKGAALTGARAGELVNATVSQFDARTKSMTFTGKTGSRVVPLSPAALELFKGLAGGKMSGDRLFVRDDGQPWAHSDWDELVREAAKAAKLPADPRTGTCLYTLRHSFITGALLGGLPTLEVARLVGTSVMMIEANYGHLCATSARKALARVAML